MPVEISTGVPRPRLVLTHCTNSPIKRQLRIGDSGGAAARLAIQRPNLLDSKEPSPPAAGESSFHVSTIIVTGPSLTRLTRIMAPNRPVSTSAPALAQPLYQPVDKFVCQVRWGGVHKRRATSPARIRVQRELADNQDRQAQLGRGPVQLPAASGKSRICQIFAARRSADVWSSCRPTPMSAHRPGPIRPITSPSTLTDASDTRCTRPRMAQNHNSWPPQFVGQAPGTPSEGVEMPHESSAQAASSAVPGRTHAVNLAAMSGRRGRTGTGPHGIRVEHR